MRLIRRGLLATLCAGAAAGAQPADDLVRVRSTRDFTQTVRGLDSALAARNLTVFTRVDHAANARGVNLELRPTTLFVFGNPQVGTRLMQCAQTSGIDLPLKALVWEDSTRAVWVGYVAPARLAERHALGECREVLDRIDAVLSALAAAAAGTGRG
ncbi:MAG TPA: DUF302 domain-containing protein [Gemmatimonadaceae bacterium]|nr:DUF302 domain-containing protein [Gemmatimonadaceae bacterium]